MREEMITAKISLNCGDVSISSSGGESVDDEDSVQRRACDTRKVSFVHENTCTQKSVNFIHYLHHTIVWKQ